MSCLSTHVKRLLLFLQKNLENAKPSMQVLVADLQFPRDQVTIIQTQTNSYCCERLLKVIILLEQWREWWDQMQFQRESNLSSSLQFALNKVALSASSTWDDIDTISIRRIANI
ncbi:PREDICTED: uncharacterized protein LOC104605039 isoform X2 [Nelumbo nucifera]|uniref:Uncharacterized protein LOC104605039 isoform X2 n=1 Tax=Nelumbo nucifera TaxID=4432 RepID=A0A1U8AXZ7_NELNU|nr:PREDICTED: uncharacterized protein LOC104605039 isoform X2 [Nelumbo nucifera]